MEYAVILRFDKETETKVFRLINDIAKVSANSYMTDTGIPPHVSLTIFSKESETGIKSIILDFVKQLKRFEMGFDSIGVFNPNVIFLAPVVTSYLLNVSSDISNKISKVADNLNAYYIPNQWVPHMALGVKMNEEELLKAFMVLQKEFHPFSGKVMKIALAECEPYREVFCVNL